MRQGANQIMWCSWVSSLLVLLLAYSCNGYKFRWPARTVQPCVAKVAISSGLKGMKTTEVEAERPSLLQPNLEDMNRLAYILANVTDHLDNAPETALTIASQEMGWLYQRNLPKLTEMLLAELPTLRQDKGMMRAYMFLLDFLEAVGGETTSRISAHQRLMRGLLEAAKISETSFDDFIARKSEKLLAPDFKVYLESEIEAAESNSAAENLLVTIQLRLLDEEGKKMGVDVMILPKLAAETDPAEVRKKTTDHLLRYDAVGRQLFLQTLRIMLAEMRKRYKQVDPMLLLNLQEVEKIAQGFVAHATSSASAAAGGVPDKGGDAELP